MSTTLDQKYRLLHPRLVVARDWMVAEGLDVTDVRDHCVFKVGRAKTGFGNKRLATRESLVELIQEKHVVHYIRMTKRVTDKSMVPYGYKSPFMLANQLHGSGLMSNQEGLCRYYPTDSRASIADKIDAMDRTKLNARNYILPQDYGVGELLPKVAEIVEVPSAMADAISFMSYFQKGIDKTEGGAVEREFNGTIVMPVTLMFGLIQDMVTLAERRF